MFEKTNNFKLLRVGFQSIYVHVITFEMSSNVKKSKNNGGGAYFLRDTVNTFLRIIFPYNIRHGITVFVIRLKN